MSQRNYKHWVTAARTDGPTVGNTSVVMRMMIDDEDVDEVVEEDVDEVVEEDVVEDVDEDDEEDVDEDDDDHLHDQQNGHDW